MTALATRIDAALALHVPCHHPDLAKWRGDYTDCQWGHGDVDGGPDPDDEALCMHCTYDARRIAWPCPTVKALQGDCGVD